MRCAERRADGRPCRRVAIAAVGTGELVTLLCGDCTLRADRLVRGLRVRWLDRRHAVGRRRPA
ncbi:MAG: hypothetical protein L0H64_20335 [Pseudonocardia sp.]|nr:hypothetical protein [Pseudonocardia sp.]